MKTAPRAGIKLKYDTLDAAPAFRDFKLHRHLGEKMLNGGRGIDSDYGFVRPGHARIGDIPGSAGEHLFISGLDMGVCAEYRAHLAVEKPAKRSFLRGGFRMEIDDDQTGMGRQFLQGRESCLKRVLKARIHKDSPLDVDDADCMAARKGAEKMP